MQTSDIVGLMLNQRRRRWARIETALVRFLVIDLYIKALNRLVSTLLAFNPSPASGGIYTVCAYLLEAI